MNKRKAALAQYVKSTRDIHELNQRELAQALDVSYTYISKIENGKIDIMPSPLFVQKLGIVRGVYPDEAMKAVGLVDSKALDAYLDEHPQAAALINAIIGISDDSIERLRPILAALINHYED